MIPLTILYDEYIDQSKLTEQKNPFENIVPPPQAARNNYIVMRGQKTEIQPKDSNNGLL